MKNDSRFATGHKTGEIKIWSLSDQREVQNIKNAFRQQITCLKFTPCFNKIVATGVGSKAKVIELRTGNTLFDLEHPDLIINQNCSQFSVSPNGKYCVIGGHQGTVFVFNLHTGQLEEAFDEEHNVAVLGIDWAPGTASTIATLDKSGLLYLWN